VVWTKLPWILSQVLEAVGPCNWWMLGLDEAAGQWSGGPLDLYYRLRRASGEARLMKEAPFHFFFRFEQEELRSVLLVALLNTWVAQLVTDLNYGRLVMSPSNGVSVWSVDPLDDLRARLEKEGVQMIDGSV
jgi:hypothetical protein